MIKVIYHKGCPDGITAAAVAYSVFKENAEYIPAIHGEDPPDVHGCDVYVLDFSYSREVCEELEANAESLVILDHHKTAEKELEGLDCAHFDMHHSGAYLTWKWFYPHEQVPQFIKYVEDRDLWRYTFPETKAFSIAFFVDMGTTNEEDMISSLGERIRDKFCMSLVVEDYINNGKILSSYQDSLVRQACEKSLSSTSENGTSIYICNSQTMQSDIGSELVKNGGAALIWYQVSPGDFRCSLRSSPGIDVSQIAKHFGGGGHACAAGCNAYPWDVFDQMKAL